jgi:predicted ATPase
MKMKLIVLTGGPCGGKSTLIDELLGIDEYRSRIMALPEAIFTLNRSGTDPRSREFQKLMVNKQNEIEQVARKNLRDEKLIIAHRGTLDPLAYWLHFGRNESEFFEFTGTDLKWHLDRYDAVIHLESTAVGAPGYYTRYPEAHRHESLEEAAHIDDLLTRVWSRHPRFVQIKNEAGGWEKKRESAEAILKEYL